MRGLLETLWESCHETGDPVVGAPSVVEAAAEWPGEERVLFCALADDGWIEEAAPGVWMVHDYYDHAPAYVVKRAEREAVRRAAGKTLSDYRREAAMKSWESRRSKPSPTGDETEGDGSKRMQKSPVAMQTDANVRTPAPAPAPLEEVSIPSTQGIQGGGAGGGANLLPGMEEPAKTTPDGVSALEGAKPKAPRKKEPRPPIPPDLLLSVPHFEEAWNRRIEALPAKDRPTPAGEASQLKECLALLKEDGAKAVLPAVEEAINRKWTGFMRSWLSERKASGGRRAEPFKSPEAALGLRPRGTGPEVDAQHDRAIAAMKGG